MTDLQQAVVRGGGELLVRRMLGMFINLLGMTVLTRLIGPGPYGVFVGTCAIAVYAFGICQLGMGTCLRRFGGDAIPLIERLAASLLLVTSALGCIALATYAIVISPLFGTASPWLTLPFAVALVSQLLAVVPLARLERHLHFPTVARIELGAQFIFYAIALPAAAEGGGAWAPAIGWLAQQMLTLALASFQSGYRLRLGWNNRMARSLLRDGISISIADCVWEMRPLVNPLVIGVILGPSAVGIIALTTRFIEALTFVRAVAWRMALPLMGHMRDDAGKLLRAMNEALPLLVFSTGVCIFAFAFVAPELISLIFGPQWNDVFVLLPWFAIAALLNALFGLHTTALYVRRRNLAAGIFHVVNPLLLLLGAIGFARSFGIVGYAYAEVIAGGSYLILDKFVAAELGGRPRYGLSLLWIAAFAAAIFDPRSWNVLALVLVFLHPACWRLCSANALRVRRFAG
jgi:O-antigen/teichoic acid export membrane protein